MEFQKLVFYILASLVILYPAWYVISYIRARKDMKKRAEQMENEVEEDSSAGEPPLQEIHGTILSKYCYSGVGGTKNVRAYTCFTIIFRSDKGEETSYEVDEECYIAVSEGQTGTVAIVGTRFYGFCPDEDA